MEFSPTEEQAAILDALRTTSANLLIKALAGAAKTSTLVLMAKATPDIPTLALSFNTIIAKEMKERLPAHCESRTLNSVGHGAWMKTLGRRLVVSTDKVYNLVTEEIQKLSGDDKVKAYEVMAPTMQAIRQGKSAGYIPDDNPYYKQGHFQRLHDDESFFSGLDEEPTDWQMETIIACSNKSIKLAMAGEIDFDDQILLPTLFNGSTFTSYPQVLLDESQDLSELNHKMLKKMIKGRLNAVGDECQAIYGFRGAHSNSMQLLSKTFEMMELVLSISFRCPQKVVTEARWRAPHMRWPEWAKEGTVRRFSHWSLSDLPDSAVILCRNNAPIFALAMKILKAGRYCEIIGADISKSLIKILEKLGDKSLSKDEVISRLATWRDEKLDKARNKGAILDQFQCLMIFAEAGNNLEDAIAYAQALFRQSGPIKLMTIHKSKGLEFDDVFILDKELMDTTPHGGQDRNLMYVAQTRAKSTLSYINSERFIDA